MLAKINNLLVGTEYVFAFNRNNNIGFSFSKSFTLGGTINISGQFSISYDYLGPSKMNFARYL